MKTKKISISLFYFIPVFLMGIILRGWNIFNKGFFIYDEAYLYLEAKPAILAIQYLTKHFFNILDKGISPSLLRDFIELNGGGVYWPSIAKPGHYVLNIIFSLIFGIHDYSTFIMAFVFGVFTLIIVFLFTKKCYGIKAALGAIAVLSISSYHILSSRSGLSVSDTTFFLTLGTYLYYLNRVSSSIKKLILAGLSIGFAFTCHQSTAIFMLFFVIYEAHRWYSDRQFFTFNKVKITTLFFSSMLTFPLLFHFATLSINLVTNKSRMTYFSQIIRIINMNSSAYGCGFDRILKFIYSSEGILGISFFIIGGLYLIKKMFFDRSFKNIILGLQAILPLIFWSVSGIKNPVFPRTIVPLLPFVAIMSGIGIAQFKKKQFIVIISVVLVFGFFRSLNYNLLNSGYKRAAEYIKTNRNGKVATYYSIAPILMFYLNDMKNVYPVETVEELHNTFNDKNVSLYIADYTINFKYDFDRANDHSLLELENKIKPDILLDNPVGINGAVIDENFISQEVSRATQLNPLSGKIRIYDLKKIFYSPAIK